LPTVIGVLVNATFVDAATIKFFTHCECAQARAPEAADKLLADGGNRQ
jgi:hypothetical protein